MWFQLPFIIWSIVLTALFVYRNKSQKYGSKSISQDIHVHCFIFFLLYSMEQDCTLFLSLTVFVLKFLDLSHFPFSHFRWPVHHSALSVLKFISHNWLMTVCLTCIFVADQPTIFFDTHEVCKPDSSHHLTKVKCCRSKTRPMSTLVLLHSCSEVLL